MTRLTLLFLVAVALVVPGSASAVAPDRDPGTRTALNRGVDLGAQDAKARATEEYYSSYGEPAAIAALDPVEPSGHAGPSWFGALGIGAGLILIAGGLGVYAGRSVRPRGLGA